MSYFSTTPIDDLAKSQLEWLEKMDWVGNTTLLEDLMLVVSECGEAANEVRGEKPTDSFRLELADIILRVMGIAAKEGISLDQAIAEKMQYNRENGKKKGRLK